MIPEYEMILRLLLAMALGGLVGWERQIDHKPAGFRTHILVCMGACLFTVISIIFPGANINGPGDPTRIASGIVMGIGFLGAGAILHEQGGIKGLTTAASMWVMAAIGMAAGCGFYFLASVAAIFVTLILFFLNKFEKSYIEKRNKNN